MSGRCTEGYCDSMSPSHRCSEGPSEGEQLCAHDKKNEGEMHEANTLRAQIDLVTQSWRDALTIQGMLDNKLTVATEALEYVGSYDDGSRAGLRLSGIAREALAKIKVDSKPSTVNVVPEGTPDTSSEWVAENYTGVYGLDKSDLKKAYLAGVAWHRAQILKDLPFGGYESSDDSIQKEGTPSERKPSALRPEEVGKAVKAASDAESHDQDTHSAGVPFLISAQDVYTFCHRRSCANANSFKTTESCPECGHKDASNYKPTGEGGF